MKLLGIVPMLVLLAAVTACSSGTATASRAPAAYCQDLKALDSDLQAAQNDYATPGPTNFYAVAELRDAQRIAADADTSSNPKTARDLALALTLDGQTRQQANPDRALLDHMGQGVVTAIKAAPGC